MTAKELLIHFQNVRKTTEEICTPLETEDYVIQPIEDVSPPKWHLGHTSWFFELFILIPYLKNYKPYNTHFNYIFNSYYESAGDRIIRSTRGNISRPTTDEIYKYRGYVDKHVTDFFTIKENQKQEILKLLELGINHEQQHQELLVTDIKYILGNNPLFPEYIKPHALHKNKPEAKARFISVPGGVYTIGHQDNGFSFDNEHPAHQVFQKDYLIADKLVTNAEYLNFMEDRGYEQHELWLSEGWDWLHKNKVQAPLYWFKIKEKWHYFTLHGLVELDPDAPVAHISYFEADAFAHWTGKRLPSEIEWEIASQTLPTNVSNANLLEKKQFRPVGNSGNQLIGDVWEWTASSYLAYPGYRKPPGAIGEYNGKFMINQMVLRGGSCATPSSHIRSTYRNFFQTNKRWQFTGLRLAADV